ncbi:MAG: hypothetical protein IJ689_02865 [Alphaproteobacteria bacterium]|nr:hypothetical protein [Alphaproteobacteria bacterium]
MKKYILMLGVAGVALGSYCAYAGNSATMSVTATIAHDVSLTKTGDISLGTITINPAYTGDTTQWGYDISGVRSYWNQGALVSAPNATVGAFTANIPNPSACTYGDWSCGGLSITGTYNNIIQNIFGGSDGDNYCDFYFTYTGSGNQFVAYVNDCDIGDVSQVTTGSHTGTLTISYTPQ